MRKLFAYYWNMKQKVIEKIYDSTPKSLREVHERFLAKRESEAKKKADGRRKKS